MINSCCQLRITVFGRTLTHTIIATSTEQIQTSIFASNVRLTRSTVDRVVPHTLLVHPCLRMQQVYACSRGVSKPTKSEDFKDSLCSGPI